MGLQVGVGQIEQPGSREDGRWWSGWRTREFARAGQGRPRSCSSQLHETRAAAEAEARAFANGYRAAGGDVEPGCYLWFFAGVSLV